MSDYILKRFTTPDGVELVISSRPVKENFYADPDDMPLPRLKEHLEFLEDELALLDSSEPEDEDSEEYDDWADRHEELEDLIDDVLDRLEGRTKDAFLSLECGSAAARALPTLLTQLKNNYVLIRIPMETML